MTEPTVRDLLDQAAADDQAIAEREARIQAALIAAVTTNAL